MKRINYIDEKEVSTITGRAVPTLRNDRHKKRGIPFYKMGRSVRYDKLEVLKFMRTRRVHTDDF